jgi:hypothetical protein
LAERAFAAHASAAPDAAAQHAAWVDAAAASGFAPAGNAAPAAAGSGAALSADPRLPAAGEALPGAAAAAAGWWLVTADHSPEVCKCETQRSGGRRLGFRLQAGEPLNLVCAAFSQNAASLRRHSLSVWVRV